jgi:hypothetical protein
MWPDSHCTLYRQQQQLLHLQLTDGLERTTINPAAPMMLTPPPLPPPPPEVDMFEDSLKLAT